MTLCFARMLSVSSLDGGRRRVVSVHGIIVVRPADTFGRLHHLLGVGHREVSQKIVILTDGETMGEFRGALCRVAGIG